ncbi:MAG: restriction endonuclease subunit S [Oscillospiraceae bacterium]|nr:restriction endonuclease subunit S [Oscillospiraceae bacterium]
MRFETKKLKDISIIRTGKLDSNVSVLNGKYPFFTCDLQILNIDNWAYDNEAVLLTGNNASGNYTAKYYNGKFNAYQRTYIIETSNIGLLNVRFLCYAINQQLKLLKIMSFGSITKFLTIRMLNNLDIPCLNIEIQNQIVSILSAYDDLIENNYKQIKLLEEASQRLYKEWFVDLCFSDYENTTIVDGVLEGWKRITIKDLSVLLRRGISPKYNDMAKYNVINQKVYSSNCNGY